MSSQRGLVARAAALLVGVLVASIATSGGSAVAAPAEASAAGESSPGMRLVKFDAAVAEANGYKVVTLPDGARASVPAALAEAAQRGDYVPTTGVIRPTGIASTSGYGEVGGNCGMSWLGLDARGGSRATLTTGMQMNPDAGGPWDVIWRVNITDNGGSSSQSYSEDDGFYGYLSWTAFARDLGLTRGTAIANVSSWLSYAITTHGWVCWSNGPVASANIY
ncbi:hypothetical protein [Dactylosporangium sp. CA-233914]|uniref:hypothetical protein n=1 Tax=Dactylosporangium sp. CA-233914 TaxID=3239934 RepID=UPI003D8DE898